MSKSAGTGIKKARKGGGAKNPEHGSYLLKIFKQVHPGCSISRDAMWVADGIVADFQDRLIAKALKAAKDEGKSTLKGKHAKAATQLMMSGELRTHAVTNGELSLAKYTQAT